VSAALGLGDDLRVALGLAHLDELDVVLELLLKRFHGLDPVDQRLALAHQLLRVGRIVPEVRVLDARVVFLEPVGGGLPVHPLTQERQRLLDLVHRVLCLGTHVQIPGTSGRPVERA